jgi:hypothetical protein
MKAHVRVLGIDDGPFSFGDRRAPLVGAVVRLPSYVEGVMARTVAVDGEDANDEIAGMLATSRYRDGLKLAIVDGAAVGGFNVVDIGELAERTGVPFATVTRDKPNMGKIEKALRANFDDWKGRLATLKKHKLRELDTGHRPLLAACAGIEFGEASEIIRASVVRGALPEPLRVAHLVASAIAKGESRGRA